MKTSIFSLFFISIASISIAQPCSSPANNLQKYWEYRERLKNFVVIGSDSGCSLLSDDRESNNIYYHDEPTPLGYYIGVLASEYYLLDTQASDTASQNQKQRTLKELYYALAAADRLDQNAEAYWRAYYSGSSYSVNSGDLNGFMLRDDVSGGFLDDFENGDYVENNLNKSLSPPPDGYRAQNLNTSFISGVTSVGSGFHLTCGSENGKPGGPELMSKDELTQFYVGLAIVSKLLPQTSNQIYMGNNLTTMARHLAIRISSSIDGSGHMVNPITGDCSTGMFWGSGANWLDQCKCGMGGSDPGTWSGGKLEEGIYHASGCINNGFTSSSRCLETLWWLVYEHDYIGGEEFMNQTLGVIGKCWGNVTGGVVNSRALDAAASSNDDIDGLPLLYTVLWGDNTANYTATYYDNLVSDAPCHGTIGNNHNYEWSFGDRWFGGPNKGLSTYSDIFFGADYMLYFNLLCVAYPTLTSSASKYTPYFYIPAKYLREPSIVKSNYTEYDEKNFAASDSIEAGNIGGNYTIANDNDPNQTLINGRAQVNYMAVHRVDLMPGFEAQYGVRFDASIDTAIHAMDCMECDLWYNAETANLPIAGPGANQINFYSSNTIRACGCDSIHYTGINGDTLGISSWYWDFNGEIYTSSSPWFRYCSGSFPTFDSLYQLMLIVTDSATGLQDTLFSTFDVYCPTAAPHHGKSSPTGDSLAIGGSYTFNLQPSITNYSTAIVYSIPKQTSVTITIFNTLGIKVETVENTIKNAGAYNFNYNTSNLPPGIYYVTMATADYFKTKKLVVIK